MGRPAGVMSGASMEAAGLAGKVRDAIVAGAGQNGGRFPEHPAELVAYHQIVVSQVVGSGMSRTTDETALVGGRTLRSLDLLPPGERLEAFQRAMLAEGVGESVGEATGQGGHPPAWRRLGDLLMPSLGGVTLEEAKAAGLWVLVVAEDPGRSLLQPGVGSFWAIGVEGEAVLVGPTEVDARLGEQHQIRSRLGLDGLTDPRSAGHWKPGG
jgi:hypothetical protein